MYINVWDFFTVTYIQCGNCTTLLKTGALLFECWKQELRLTIVFTMLLGHVSFPGLWRVVMHSQYLSMKGMISCKEILDTQDTKQLERTWTLFCLGTRGSAMFGVPAMHLILWKHCFWVFLLSAWPPGQVGQGWEAHFLQIWKCPKINSEAWNMTQMFLQKGGILCIT